MAFSPTGRAVDDEVCSVDRAVEGEVPWKMIKLHFQLFRRVDLLTVKNVARGSHGRVVGGVLSILQMPMRREPES